MPEINLRPANPDDLVFVSQCAEAAYRLYVARIGKKPAPMVADFAAAERANQLEIMQAGEVPVGFCVSFPKGDHLFVENIALHPDFQGKGFGGAAFTLLEKRARSNKQTAIELYTNEKMTENLAFYPQLGFHEVARVSEDGFNRVYFRKDLT